MSERSQRNLRRLVRKTLNYHYDEFLKDVAKCKLGDRLRIAWQVIKRSDKEKKDDS